MTHTELNAILDALYTSDYKEGVVVNIFAWAIKKTFTDDAIDAPYVVEECLMPLLDTAGYVLKHR